MVSVRACALVGGLVVSGLVVPAPASAEVSAGCLAHLSRVEAATGQRVTAAEDRRHWLERGQQARYCSEADVAEESGGSYRETAEEPREEHSDGKSRYCRKRWFC